MVLPLESASQPSAGSTSSSGAAMRDFQRGVSVSSHLASHGGDLGLAFLAASKVISPPNVKNYLTTTTCSIGKASPTTQSSLAATRTDEARSARAARCEMLCKRIVNVAVGDPALEPLTAAWIFNALQVAKLDADKGLDLPLATDYVAPARVGVAPSGSQSIENFGARFFGMQDTRAARSSEHRPSEIQCRAKYVHRTEQARADFERGKTMWTRVHDAFPRGSDLKFYARDWVRAYELSAADANCEDWEARVAGIRPSRQMFGSDVRPPPPGHPGYVPVVPATSNDRR
jgi:hypothetical protein